MEELLRQLTEVGINAGVALLRAALILIVGLKASGILLKIIKRSKGFARMEATPATFILSLLKIVFNASVVIAALATLGVPMTAFITLITSCGVAIGLALQGSLSNFAGGLMILIFKPFEVGDYIEAGGHGGTVESISVLYTVLTTADNKSVTLPNGNLTNDVVVNYNAHDTRRHTFTFTVDSGADMDTVKGIILAVLESDPLTISEPAPSVGVESQTDTAVIYSAKVWCKSEHYWDVRYSVPEALKRAFDDKGIRVPHPRYEIAEKK